MDARDERRVVQRRPRDLRQCRLEFRLGVHVGDCKALLPRLMNVGVVLPCQRALDVLGSRVLAFDLVRVIRKHRAQQRAKVDASAPASAFRP
ncbi:MAG: hypothetical protein ABI624_15230 [Casimicrobiaceae bacterium]